MSAAEAPNLQAQAADERQKLIDAAGLASEAARKAHANGRRLESKKHRIQKGK